MADYAGAVQAIRDRLAANWTTTPIAYQNEAFDAPVDPNSGNPTAWVALEVIGNGSEQRTIGGNGGHDWIYRGHILAHVFVPVNDGIATAHAHAVTLGEIFRGAQFYDSTAAHCVRSAYGGEGPSTDGGGISADQGNWFRVTMTCPFEYYHRG